MARREQRLGGGLFSSFGSLADYAARREIPVVPVVFNGTFRTEDELQSFIGEAHAQASALGGEREGVVIRLARSFPASEFSRSICKSVRAGHVQTVPALDAELEALPYNTRAGTRRLAARGVSGQGPETTRRLGVFGPTANLLKCPMSVGLESQDHTPMIPDPTRLTLISRWSALRV